MSTVLDRLRQDHERLSKVFHTLEAEIGAWASGQVPDIVLIESCLSYCTAYCDLAHHAREDKMFARMLEKDRVKTESATEDLHAMHVVLTDRTRALQRAVQDGMSGNPDKIAAIKTLTADFLRIYGEHMAFEENTLFPAAEQILDGADWIALESEDPARADPLFGKQVDHGFDRLYRKIIAPEDRRATVPLGDTSHLTEDDSLNESGQRTIRFGSFVQEASTHAQSVSYNYLTPTLHHDESGKDIPYQAPKLRPRAIDVYRLLGPYVGIRFYEQVKAVVPLALYLAVFQVLILRQVIDDGWSITMGLTAVIFGLMLFMEGLKLGLMPFAEVIGDTLPKKSSLAMVLTIAFILGIGVTFAEPAIGALQAAGSLVDATSAPYLYTLLNDWPGVLVMVVGAGVGFAAVLGTVRFLKGWSLKPYIYCALAPTLILTIFISFDPNLSTILGLAWDCGAVTTGPVTVPLVLSLGIGIASAAGKGNSSLSGFGIVTLASLFPIIGVMSLGLYVSWTVTPEEIIAAASVATVVEAEPAWYELTPAVEIIGGIRAIVPLVLFLFLIFKVLLHATLQERGIVFYGLTLCVVGMCVFNIGLSYGLSALGAQSGQFVPAAFQYIDGIMESPLYVFGVGIVIAIGFAWVLGLGATLAEPALNALGVTVENLTHGAFRKRTLMYAVSLGVAFGIAIGVAKIVFSLPIVYLLLPAYLLAIVLTALSSEEFVNIAWDSAGVTTGPVTVPLVLAMGLGLGDAVTAIEGFGILSMASIGPILSVLSTGLFVQWATNRRTKMKYAPEGAR
jgi:hemerythrin-like domain-containing protein